MAKSFNEKRPLKKETKQSSVKKKPKINSKSILNINHDYLDNIFNNVGFGVMFFSPDWKIEKVNTAAEQMLGYSEQELKELNSEQISHPADYKIQAKLQNELIEGKRGRFQLDKRYLTKDGKILFGRLTLTKLNIDNGEFGYIGLIEDLNEQKDISSKLESEQLLLKALLDNIPDSIYFKDLKSKFIKVNKYHAIKHGYQSSDEIIGKSDFDSFSFEKATEKFNDEQEIIRTQIPIINKLEKEKWADGHISWSSTTKMPLMDSDEKVIGTFGLTRDITEQIQNQEQVKENEKIYRSLFENSVDGMFLMTDVFLDCNQTICDLFQYDRLEIIGNSPSAFSPEFQPDGKHSFEAAKERIESANNGIPQRFYWQHKRKDGSKIDCEVSLKAITIRGKNLVQAIVRDITKRLRGERIKESLLDISEAAHMATDMYSFYQKIHEAIGKLMSAKNFYIALFEEHSDTISFPYMVDEEDAPFPPKKRSKGLTEYVLFKGKAILITPEMDLELRRLGEVELVGSPAAIWLGVPLKLENKTIGVIVVQDYENEKAFGEEEMQILTFVAEQIAHTIERKNISEDIKKYTEELKQLNNTKDKFFSIIAHDLRNPFITILGFSDLLVSDYTELSDEEKLFYIQEMKKSAEVSHNLLQNLLQWSRSQTGKIDFHPQKLNLQSIIKTDLDLLLASASKKEINLTSDITEELFVLADEDMLNTVIRNLITNAIKFTPKKGSINISAMEDEKSVTISIADTGIGMDDKVINNLFRLDVSQTKIGTENEAGTGLGLILCKEFVEKNGGKIWVESELGKGSKFIFSLVKPN